MITRPLWYLVLGFSSVCPARRPACWRYSSATLTVSPASRGMALLAFRGAKDPGELTGGAVLAVAVEPDVAARPRPPCEWTQRFSRVRVSNSRWPFVGMVSGADGAAAKGADHVHRYRLSRRHRHPAPADQDAAAGHRLRRCAGRRGHHCRRCCPAGRRSPAGCARQDSASGLRPAHFPRGGGRRGAPGRADPARLRSSSAVHPGSLPGSPRSPVPLLRRSRTQPRARYAVPAVYGPSAETKEQMGAFWVIEASDLDAALAWAGKRPRPAGKLSNFAPPKE